MKATGLVDHLETRLRQLGLPEPAREYRFDARTWINQTSRGPRTRRLREWRFDFAWPEYRVAAEVDGGTWTGGRHVRGKGFEDDCEKINMATEQGWRVFRYPGSAVLSDEAAFQLQRVLQRAAGGTGNGQINR